jgi:hypothetical protein
MSVQRAVGCLIGRDYPAPIVEHAVVLKANMARIKAAYGLKRYGVPQLFGAVQGLHESGHALPPALRQVPPPSVAWVSPLNCCNLLQGLVLTIRWASIECIETWREQVGCASGGAEHEESGGGVADAGGEGATCKKQKRSIT